MPDASDIDGCLTATHAQLGVLVQALARADAAAIEMAAEVVGRATAQLRTVALLTAEPAHPARARAIDDLRWMTERARRLGRVFGDAVADGPPKAYQPDGRAATGAHRISTLEVMG